MSKDYDIIFVYGLSRLHPYLLNLIRHLGGDFKIGVCLLDYEKYTGFISLCRSLGADILELDGQKEKEGGFSARLLLMSQLPINEAGIGRIRESISFGKLVALQGFGYGSLFLDELVKMGCKSFLVYDRNIFTSVVTEQKREDLLDKLEIKEMGAPYLKYPLWDKDALPRIDYLIALPTLVFLQDQKKRLALMKKMYELIKDIDEREKLVIKLHNVRDGGNRYVREMRLGAPAAWLFERFLGLRGVSWAAGIFYRRILERCIPLAELTPHYNLGLELFLPYVDKGIITGISTVTWHALYNKIPVYNCDPQPFGEHLPNYSGYRNFYVPFCGARLVFDQRHYAHVPESSRTADLLELIRKEVS